MKRSLQIFNALILALLSCVATATAQTGSISGTVTAQQDGENITDGTIYLYAVSDTVTTVAQADLINGAYTFTNVADGSYYVQTVNARTSTDNYIDDVYNGIQCQSSNCDYSSATAVTISGGNAQTGINFVLVIGGQITGRITDGTNPLPGFPTIYLYNTAKNVIESASAQPDGTYDFFGLTTDSYFLIVANPGYQSILYNNILCPNFACLPAHSANVSVTATQTTANINFVLPIGATISGTLTDAVTHAAIANGTVVMYDSNNTEVGEVLGDSSGNFSFPDGLATGKYYLLGFADGYISELYNNFSCESTCTPITSTPISVHAGQATNLSFTLRANLTANLPDLSGKFSGIPATKTVRKPTFTVQNKGILGVSKFKVTFFRAAKKIITPKTRIIKIQVVQALAAGAKIKITFTLKSDPKLPYLIAQIDRSESISERSKLNDVVIKKL